MQVYADNAATTKLSDVALQAMLPYFDTVYGKCNNFGRLSVSFPKHVGQLPINYNYKNEDYTLHLIDNYDYTWKEGLTTEYNLNLYFMDTNGNYIEGKPEAIVPQTNFIVNGQINPNIEIISHSKNMTTAKLMQIAQIYLSKSEQFRGRDDISIDHWSLTDGLDKDIEILRKFKETLTKEEQKYLSQLIQ